MKDVLVLWLEWGFPQRIEGMAKCVLLLVMTSSGDKHNSLSKDLVAFVPCQLFFAHNSICSKYYFHGYTHQPSISHKTQKKGARHQQAPPLPRSSFETLPSHLPQTLQTSSFPALCAAGGAASTASTSFNTFISRSSTFCCWCSCSAALGAGADPSV